MYQKISYILLTSSVLFATTVNSDSLPSKSKISNDVVKNLNYHNQEVILTKDNFKGLEGKLNEYWKQTYLDNPRLKAASGYVDIKLILNTAQRKIIYYYIKRKQSKNKLFDDLLSNFTSKIKNLTFDVKGNTKDAVISEITMHFEINKDATPNKTIDLWQYSLHQGIDEYKSYIRFLKNKGYSVNQIKNWLNRKDTNYQSDILFGLYYLNTGNAKNAHTYLVRLTQKWADQIKGKEDLVFIGDWLLKNNPKFIIDVYGSDLECKKMLDDKYQKECLYYRGLALYLTGKNGYENTLKKVRLEYPQVIKIIRGDV